MQLSLNRLGGHDGHRVVMGLMDPPVGTGRSQSKGSSSRTQSSVSAADACSRLEQASGVRSGQAPRQHGRGSGLGSCRALLRVRTAACSPQLPRATATFLNRPRAWPQHRAAPE